MRNNTYLFHKYLHVHSTSMIIALGSEFDTMQCMTYAQKHAFQTLPKW